MHCSKLDPFLLLRRARRLADRRQQPDGVAKQIGVGMLDAAVLLAGHGMSGQHALRGLSAQHHARALHHLLLGAAGIGDQHVRRQHRRQAFDQRQDGADRRGENDDVAAGYRLARIGMGAVHRSAGERRLQHVRLVAADNAMTKAALPQRHAQRAANQSGTDDGDLHKKR